MARIDAFFKLMFDQGASDLHVVAGQQPILRINGDLVQAVGHLAGERREGGGHATHVGAVDRDGRGERAGVGLGLGDTGALLHVGVQRHGDGGEDADDRHDDQELDQREAALSPQRRPTGVEEPVHSDPFLR